MSVTIRLAKFGKRNAPTYKVVATQTKTKRNGRFLEVLGFVNPQRSPIEIDIDKEKFEKWVGQGALVTTAVEKAIKGEYTFEPYAPKTAKSKSAEQAPANPNADKDAETAEAAPEPKTAAESANA